eukprot:TRINITY_DN20567_c0_g1_i2.p1 TRINITY_DN20567_c0_g1~~TRINITY_DN20567_c0_g1_i2.p1  ORF type:complete len:144 (+),score=26.43 TRINITY_DN20567_c0_g1_i2:95-526(+)
MCIRDRINEAYDCMYELRPEEAGAISKMRFNGYPIMGIKLYLRLANIPQKELELLSRYKVLQLTRKYKILWPSDPNVMRQDQFQRLRPEDAPAMLASGALVKLTASDGAVVYRQANMRRSLDLRSVPIYDDGSENEEEMRQSI